MNIRRLDRMVKLLYKLPKKKEFHMTHWKCGTSCCAIGWAAQDPWFIKQGLSLRRLECSVYQPVYKKWKGMVAVQKFFGMEHFSDTGFLFGSHNPNDPKIVGLQIANYVADSIR